MTNSKLKERLENSSRPLILDGAIGSLLQQRGYKTDKHLWTSYLNFKHPKVIENIHREYINAGCDIITTNTFRTKPYSLQSISLDIDQEKVIELSLSIAKNATKETNVLIAGSNAPVEDCYQIERTISKNILYENHQIHIDLLLKYGADFILNETQSHFDEIEIVCKYCHQNNIPYLISLLLTADLKILSGENVVEVLEMISQYSPELVSFNCIYKDTFEKLLNSNLINFNWGFYINCGSGNYFDENISCGITPSEYLEIVKTSLPFNPKLIGSCCGSNPDHIKKIREYFNE
jgi:homocysteine S-methyltransferase